MNRVGKFNVTFRYSGDGGLDGRVTIALIVDLYNKKAPNTEIDLAFLQKWGLSMNCFQCLTEKAFCCLRISLRGEEKVEGVAL